MYLNIEVVSEKELNQNGPEELRNGKNEHEILINRLKYELLLRKK